MRHVIVTRGHEWCVYCSTATRLWKTEPAIQFNDVIRRDQNGIIGAMIITAVLSFRYYVEQNASSDVSGDTHPNICGFNNPVWLNAHFACIKQS